jgi:hypothetical protein
MMLVDSANAEIRRWQRASLLIGVVGLLLTIVGFVIDLQQTLRSYLFAYLYWLGMGLGSMGILLLHHTVGGKWGMLIRRMCEAGSRTLPYMAILLLPILLSIRILYPWATPEASHDANIQAKSAYLNVPFFLARALVYFFIWTFYAWRLSTWSAAQDQTGEVDLIAKMRSISAPGLVVFVFFTTFSFIDWVMSLEPHWFSTIYGVMFLVGQVLESFAFVIALVILLSKWPPLKEHVTVQHLHDLGNMMFAFMVLWAYLSFSQFLIIWAGNLPDEIPWYLRRLRGGWGWVALTLVLFHFATPFVLLLMRKTKRHAQRLIRICLLMIAIRIVDVYWVVKPAFYGGGFTLYWVDFVAPLAIGGLWLALFFWQLNSRSLVPIRDPRLQGAPRETVAF